MCLHDSCWPWQEEVEAALAREIDAPRLRTMLASKEAETESQVKMLAGACAAKRPVELPSLLKWI